MPKIKEQDWLKKHLTRLMSLEPALKVFLKNNSTSFNEYGAWTALKLPDFA